jgi:hypothetical protein
LEAFGAFFWTFHGRLYRWDLWAAGKFVNGGMGEDSFSDFRGWIISRGRSVYERVQEEPDSLADLAEVRAGPVDAETLTDVIFNVYEDTQGRELPAVGEPEPAVPLGVRHDDSDFARMFPRLSALRRT